MIAATSNAAIAPSAQRRSRLAATGSRRSARARNSEEARRRDPVADGARLRHGRERNE